MPSVAYINQSAPFWDFIANLEQQAPFGQNRNDDGAQNEHEHREHQEPQDPFAPWNWGHPFFGGGRGMPHRGGPQAHHENHQEEPVGEKQGEMNDANDNGEGPSGTSGSDNETRAEEDSHTRARHGRCGGGPRGRGRCGRGGGRGGFGSHHGPGPHHGPSSHHGGRRGGWGPWAHGAPFGRMGGGPFGFGGGNSFDPSAFVTQLFNQFNDQHPSNARDNTRSSETEDHTPEADIFDTESAYVIHVSLPGARKEDVGVNWDAEKSELSVAGVIYRPGDEEFLRTLAMDERKAGPFERKIRLGTRANPASIDADGITAKLEDGVLRVHVPKLDSGYVEIRKVDIE